MVRIADRAEAWLAQQGFGRAGDGGRERGEEDALLVIQSASVAGRSAVGGGRRAKRVQVLGGRPFRLPPLCASCDGYSVHAGVVIGARNRKGLGADAIPIAAVGTCNPGGVARHGSCAGTSRGRRLRKSEWRPCRVVGFGLG